MPVRQIPRKSDAKHIIAQGIVVLDRLPNDLRMCEQANVAVRENYESAAPLPPTAIRINLKNVDLFFARKGRYHLRGLQ
jgi:hypothetical protein